MTEKKIIALSFAHEKPLATKVRGKVVIVVDVLRASSTIIQALDCGATQVLPFISVAEARRRKVRLGSQAVLAGERNGLPIEGFDMGNSPRECKRRLLEGKDLIITTTNGTRAILKALGAGSIFLGALSNARAVAEVALSEGIPIHLVLAGVEEEWAADDFFAAGAIIEEIMREKAAEEYFLHDSAMVARDYFRAKRKCILEVLRSSTSGQKLLEISYGRDLAWCAKINRTTCVPKVLKSPLRIVRKDGRE